MFLTTQQIKAARALLEWDQHELANRSGVSFYQITELESGRARASKVLEAVHRTFINNGLDFADGGVIHRKYEIRTLRGQQGFWDFFDDVYETVKEHGGDILVHNVDERLFEKWLGEKRFPHRERMHKLTNFQQKIVVREGDAHFTAKYATTQYRWSSANESPSTPFYLYGHKLAMIIFKEDDVSVYIIDQPEIAESYKTLFMDAWDRAKIPPAMEG